MAAPTLRPSVSIEVVSDFVCPWCLIGTRRLDIALESFPDAVVEHHPFLLDPSLPAEGADLRARLTARFGDPGAMFTRVELAARQSGIPLSFDKVRRWSSTIDAHTVVRHARARGTQRALVRAIFAAYFLDGLDIGDREVLRSIATSHGFVACDVDALLATEAERAETRADAQRAADRGIRGVPHVLIGGRFAISGAQPVDVFREALERARSSTAGA